MLSKFVVVACLAMLSEGAIELTLSKMSDNAVSAGAEELQGGIDTNHGGYVAEVTVGGQDYRLLCDTGSSDLLIVGNSCKTYPRDTCGAKAQHVGKCSGPSGSFSGNYTGVSTIDCYGTPGTYTFANFDIYESNVAFGGVQASNQYVGYITKQSVGMWGFGEYALDGIIGLAYKGLSSIYEKTNGEGETFMTTITSENDLPHALAMCFDPSGAGGKMVIGGGELENMQFTPITKDAWYTVNMTSISMGGTTSPYALGMETIVDSGTTEFVVPGDILADFASEICPALSQMGISCDWDQNYDQQNVVPQQISMTAEMLATLPDITINLPGVTLVVPPHSYFLYTGNPASGESYDYNYGIGTDGSFYGPQGSPAIILGDVVLKGHWVYFDGENGRVGFTKIDNCNQQY